MNSRRILCRKSSKLGGLLTPPSAQPPLLTKPQIAKVTTAFFLRFFFSGIRFWLCRGVELELLTPFLWVPLDFIKIEKVYMYHTKHAATQLFVGPY